MKDLRLSVSVPGERLDRFLARCRPEATRARWRELIEAGRVTVSGARRPADHRLRPGDSVVVSSTTPEWGRIPFEEWVVHEDAALLVLNKPSGLLMHPLGESWLRDPAAAAFEVEPNMAGLLARARPKIVEAGTPRCGLVHRLDRETSGVLAVAKTPEAHRRLVAAFAERRVEKVYRAVVVGSLGGKRVDVEAPVGRRPGRRRVEVTPWGREAKTRFRVLGEAPGLSLVEAAPLTGRTHQIRVHLALMKHPVLGDDEWVKGPENAALRAAWSPAAPPEPPRMLLHAWRLTVPHPAGGRPVRFTAPLPTDFRTFWKAASGRSLRS